jgi:hypothetical protein
MTMRVTSLPQRRMKMPTRKATLVRWLAMGIGLLGIVLQVMLFGRTYAAIWTDSGPLVSTLFVIALLLFGGPLLISAQVVPNSIYSGPLLLSTIALHVVEAILALLLARSQDRNPRRWRLVSLMTPFVPGIMLAVLGNRAERRHAPMPTPPTSPLVNKLLSTRLEARQHGLQEVYELTRQGDRGGLDAVEGAIRRLAGRSDISFFRPRPGVDAVIRESAGAAPEMLIYAAENGTLLERPVATQVMILGAAVAGHADRVMNRIAAIGGVALHAYQLLGVDLQVYSELKSKGVSGLPM